MMGFDWLMRLLEPGIEFGLRLQPGDFEDGHLTRSVEIDSANDVNLTRLDFTLEDKFVKVRSRVEKNGFCYTLTFAVTRRLPRRPVRRRGIYGDRAELRQRP